MFSSRLTFGVDLKAISSFVILFICIICFYFSINGLIHALLSYSVIILTIIIKHKLHKLKSQETAVHSL